MTRVSAFALIQSLLRGLSHSVRTPLSVISNDLFFLQATTGSEESKRALERCKEVSAILSITQRLGGEPLDAQRVNLSPIIEPFLTPQQTLTPFVVSADGRRLTLCLSETLKALALQGPMKSVDILERTAVITFSLNEEPPPLQGAAWHMLLRALGSDSLWPACLDALSLDQGLSCEWDIRQKSLSVTLTASSS